MGSNSHLSQRAPGVEAAGSEIHGRRIHPTKIPRIRFLMSRTTPQVNGWVETLSQFERAIRSYEVDLQSSRWADEVGLITRSDE